jgi:hypothetical protein
MIIRQLRVPGNRLTAFLVFVLTTIFFMSLRSLPCLGGWNEAAFAFNPGFLLRFFKFLDMPFSKKV